QDQGPRKSETCGGLVVSAASRSPPFSDPSRLIKVATRTLKQRIVPPPPSQFAIRVRDVRQVDIQITREGAQVHTTPIVDALSDLTDELDIHGGRHMQTVPLNRIKLKSSRCDARTPRALPPVHRP